MFDFNNIDRQLGFIGHDIQNNITKYIKDSSIIGIVNLAKTRKKREVSINFKTYAFKVAYYLASEDCVQKLIDRDEFILRNVWEFASLVKANIFPQMFGRDWLQRDCPEALLSDGTFENEFLKCVYQMLLICKDYESGDCVIPFDSRFLRFRSVRQDGYCNILVQVFAEDLLFSESIGIWEYGVNYYGSNVKSQLANRIKYDSNSLNNYVSFILSLISSKIKK